MQGDIYFVQYHYIIIATEHSLAGRRQSQLGLFYFFGINMRRVNKASQAKAGDIDIG